MLTIDDPEIERLIHEEAAKTGRKPVEALRSILAEVRPVPRTAPVTVSPEERARRRQVIREIQESVARLPVLDPRSMDELLGYDANGLPT